MPLPSTRKIISRLKHDYELLQPQRRARSMFIKDAAGPYYNKISGNIGDAPLNMIANTIRVLMPSLVFSFPRFNVESRFPENALTAEMYSLALEQSTQELDLRKVYRRAIVDAFFAPFALMKTGLAESGSIVQLDNTDGIDPGTIFTGNVSFDSVIVDSTSMHDISQGRYIGERITLPRQALLRLPDVDKEVVKALPSASKTRSKDAADAIGKRKMDWDEVYSLDDMVTVVEVYFPDDRKLLTLPDVNAPISETAKPIRETDYYGPDSGPYTVLELGFLLPDQSVGVSPVSMWYDLHVLSNRVARKAIEQAERQKDILLYRPSAIDDAESIRLSDDGDVIAVDDPDSIRKESFGGANRDNLSQVNVLSRWFNLMAGNPETVGGFSIDADTATEANILAQNAGTVMADLKDAVYLAVQNEARKRLWFIHTDPFIEAPLTRRTNVPDPTDPLAPGRTVDIPILLTPETRTGEALDYNVKVEPESMGRVDTRTRLRDAMNFGSQILPTAVTAAVAMGQVGQPFSLERYLTRMARYANIDWIEEVFSDPEADQRAAAARDRVPTIEAAKAVADLSAINQQRGRSPSAPAPEEPETLSQQFQNPVSREAQSQLRSET